MTDEPTFSMLRVPKDEDGRLEILSVRPRLWEYLLFGNRLYVGREKYDLQWRDHQLGFTMHIGQSVEHDDLPNLLSDRFSRVQAIVSNLERILVKPAQDKAFGLPGEPGDPALIDHMALRLTQMYGQLLSWAEEMRSLRVPSEAEYIRDLTVEFVSQPIQQSHDFVDEYIANIELVISKLASGTTEYEEVAMKLSFEISESLSSAYDSEFDRLRRYLGK